MGNTQLPAALGELVAALAELHCGLWHARNTMEHGCELDAARARQTAGELEAAREDLIEGIDCMVSEAALAHGKRAANG